MSAEVIAAREAAFRENLTVSGEPLVLMAGTTELLEVAGIVDRNLQVEPTANGQVDFTERNMTMVEVLRSDMTEEAKVGMTFLDTDDQHHRIRAIRRTDVVWRYNCEADSEE